MKERKIKNQSNLEGKYISLSDIHVTTENWEEDDDERNGGAGPSNHHRYLGEFLLPEISF